MGVSSAYLAALFVSVGSIAVILIIYGCWHLRSRIKNIKGNTVVHEFCEEKPSHTSQVHVINQPNPPGDNSAHDIKSCPDQDTAPPIPNDVISNLFHSCKDESRCKDDFHDSTSRSIEDPSLWKRFAEHNSDPKNLVGRPNSDSCKTRKLLQPLPRRPFHVANLSVNSVAPLPVTTRSSSGISEH